MCAGKEFQEQGADTEQAREEKLLATPGEEIGIGRTQ